LLHIDHCITLFHYNTGDHWTIIQKLKQVQNNMINYIYLPPEQRPMVVAILQGIKVGIEDIIKLLIIIYIYI
jgi:hypothetical protein